MAKKALQVVAPPVGEHSADAKQACQFLCQCIEHCDDQERKRFLIMALNKAKSKAETQVKHKSRMTEAVRSNLMHRYTDAYTEMY